MNDSKPAHPAAFEANEVVKDRYSRDFGRIVQITGRRSDGVYEYQIEWTPTKTTYATPETDLLAVT